MSEENISFEELLNNSMKTNKKLEKITEGTVIDINDKGEIFVDLNYKVDGIIPRSEYSFDENVNPKDECKPGDKIKVEVLKLNDGQGNVLLSCKRLKQQENKKEFEEDVKNNKIFHEKVFEQNDKGLVVNYKGIRIFIPHSLSAGQKEEVKFKVIENNPKEHKIIGSAKAVIDEEKKAKEDAFWSEAKVGNEYVGTVSSVCSYGAFIDINGVQGLLHISEMSWDRDAKADEILKPGQQVKVQIKELDVENKRMKLSYEGKGEDPWNKISYQVGDVVKVKIKKLVPFGAFAEVKKGVEGLIHISQISEQKIAKPEEKLEIGEKVNAKIIDIDIPNKKLELSIKDLEGTSQEYSSKHN